MCREIFFILALKPTLQRPVVVPPHPLLVFIVSIPFYDLVSNRKPRLRFRARLETRRVPYRQLYVDIPVLEKEEHAILGFGREAGSLLLTEEPAAVLSLRIWFECAKNLESRVWTRLPVVRW